MRRTLNSLRGDLVFMLEKFELLYEDMIISENDWSITIIFIRRNNTRQFQHFIHYLNKEEMNYNAYFDPIIKRIKVVVFGDE